ncbi:histidine N-acetyltransferase-like [Gigantopelta aegis]|uniref:histidine N-acetyltransferase-like n=1 Tax=Gigantopelta aegis TaxID=1735272 RepID=UPI001B88922F|nr:histidine N-acetyltransferase-like [Gigantopelta aegis]XP_041368665.1 histidine N-acetyltransferase-like [Gigantopelta aegis]XP_041368666.1 histidine N-acetyltransferase-like [Gigantopelta aegis]XP_041368667.1 histidine N-acetyltransferase-like [Gigantopelta aegis]
MSRLLLTVARRLFVQPSVTTCLEYRCNKKHAVSCREAILDDYQDVMAIAEVYQGRDYLPSKYEAWIKSDNIKCYVALVNDDIAAFSAGHIIDNGETAVRLAGRVKDTYQRQGVVRTLGRFIRKQFSSSGLIKFDTFATASLTYDPSKDISSKILYKETFVKNILAYRFKIKDLKISSNDMKNMPSSFQMTDMEAIFSSDATCKHLFPNKRFLTDWVPFRLLSSNIDDIIKPDTLMLATSGHDRPNNDVISTFLTTSSHFPCKIGLAYNVNVFGDDVTELPQHILMHLENMRQISSDPEVVISLFVVTPENIVRADIDRYLCDTNISRYRDAEQFTKKRVFERPFSE